MNNTVLTTAPPDGSSQLVGIYPSLDFSVDVSA